MNHDILMINFFETTMNILKTVKLLVDKGRIRILRLLEREELSVVELQEILGMGQSRISMQLSQLKQAGFVEVRKAGQKSMYRAAIPDASAALVTEILEGGGREIPECSAD